MDKCYINAASQLYMAGLGHLVMVSNGQMLHKCSISAVHDRSWSSCNGISRYICSTTQCYQFCYTVVKSGMMPLSKITLKRDI